MVKVCYLCKRPFEKASTRSYHLFPRDPDERKKWFECLNMRPNFSRSIVLCSDHFSPSVFFHQSGGRRKLVPKALPNIASVSGSAKLDEVVDSSSSSVTTTTSTETTATSTETDSQCPPKEEIKDESQCASVTSRGSASDTRLLIRTPVPIIQVPSPSSATKSASETEEFMEKPDKDTEVETSLMGPCPKRMELSDTSSVCSVQTKSSSTISKMEKRNLLKSGKGNFGDIQSDDFSTLSKAKRHWRIAQTTVFSQKKKIKALQQRSRRLKNREIYLKLLVKDLLDHKVKTENAEIAFEASLPPSSVEVLKRLLKEPS